MGVDPNKLDIVKSCLEASFNGVHLDETTQRFGFDDGKQSSELEFNREFIDDTPVGRLKDLMAKNIVPTLKANPGKKIYVSTRGGIGVIDKDPN